MSEANQYIMAIDAGVQRVERLVAHMEDILAKWDRKPFVDALKCFRGFQTVAAMITISELGDLSRFTHPRSLMGYLGMVPGENSTGSKRRQGAITKTGNGHARWMLNERQAATAATVAKPLPSPEGQCASHYSHSPRVSEALSARQVGQSAEVRAVAWRAQQRLNRRYLRLKARGLNRNKVVVAIARELCGFLWELYPVVAAEQKASQVVANESELACSSCDEQRMARRPGRAKSNGTMGVYLLSQRARKVSRASM